MKNVLIISGHTDLAESIANKQILETLHSKLPTAEIVKLDTLYPNYKIDPLKEQQRVKKADIIVFVFPLFWFAAPPILYRWLEKTFVHGFAHDSKGGKLKGKTLLISVTAGAPENLYTKDGVFGHTIEEFMQGMKATCLFSGMKFGGLVFTGGVSYANRTSPEMIKKQKEVCVKHAEQVVEKIMEISKEK